MIMSEFELNAIIREEIGKSASGRLRRNNLIPCILYGAEEDTICLSINRRDINKLLSEAHSLINLNYNDKKQTSVIKDIQYHPVKGDIIHVDLQRVKADEEIHISVPLKFIGSAAGVKTGGIFQELKTQLNITCLPKFLPYELEVDVSSLEIGDSIHVKDISFENITINDEPESTICSVVIPKKVVEVVEVEEGIEGEKEEPEVITARAGEEEEEEEEEGKKEKKEKKEKKDEKAKG
jgi:large subunit ribosomal protein L25